MFLALFILFTLYFLEIFVFNYDFFVCDFLTIVLVIDSLLYDLLMCIELFHSLVSIKRGLLGDGFIKFFLNFKILLLLFYGFFNSQYVESAVTGLVTFKFYLKILFNQKV